MTLNGNWSKESGESRTEEYRAWRTMLSVGAVCDLDQIEYDPSTGKAIVAIEICVADRMSESCPAGVRPGQPPSPVFFEKVEEKVSVNRPQGLALRDLVATLGIQLLLLVYIKDELETAGVWVKRVDAKNWQWLPIDEHRRRLCQMHVTARAKRQRPA